MTNRRELAGRLEGCITASGGIDLRDPEILREAARLLREPVAGEVEAALRRVEEWLLYEAEPGTKLAVPMLQGVQAAILRARYDEELKGGEHGRA